jgi:hypothetical protein
MRLFSQVAIFASGDLTQPGNIVASMRNGSSEYVDRSAGHDALLEALTRFTSSRTRALRFARRARVFTFLNAKGAQDAPPRSELVTQLNALLAPKGQSARA